MTLCCCYLFRFSCSCLPSIHCLSCGTCHQGWLLFHPHPFKKNNLTTTSMHIYPRCAEWDGNIYQAIPPCSCGHLSPIVMIGIIQSVWTAASGYTASYSSNCLLKNPSWKDHPFLFKWPPLIYLYQQKIYAMFVFVGI